MLRFGSLFAGIGGFDLGFERAGMRCEWQVEIDPYCQRVLAKHWPTVRRWDDVRTFPPEPIDQWRVDVICGGFPCQDISSAGLRAGIHGERSGLFAEAVRIISVLRPRFAILENVSALLDTGLGVVLGALAEVGFDAEWHCLPAAGFGAYHIRDRVFILAYANGNRWSPICSSRGITGEKSRKATSEWRGHKPKLKRGIGRRVWAVPAPEILGVADGFSRGVDENRLKGMGNAVVPQVAEWIGRRIVEATQV